MEITITIPDKIAKRAAKNRQDITRQLLEAFALEGYRAGRLTPFEVGEMLDIKTPMQVDEFLKRHGAFIEYTEAEINAQRMALDETSPPTTR